MMLLMLCLCGGMVHAQPKTRHSTRTSADTTIYDTTDEMPQPDLGSGNFTDSIRYPDVARENNIQGRVMVQFVVNKDGSVSHIEILRTPMSPYRLK